MSDTPESIKIKMLEDAGFHSISLQVNYVKCVDFIKWAYENSHIAERAKKLLKEIGEL